MFLRTVSSAPFFHFRRHVELSDFSEKKKSRDAVRRQKCIVTVTKSRRAARGGKNAEGGKKEAAMEEASRRSPGRIEMQIHAAAGVIYEGQTRPYAIGNRERTFEDVRGTYR